MDLSVLRYSDDDPSLYGFSTVERDPGRQIQSRALSQHIRVSGRVLPSVFQSVHRAREQLAVERETQAYVYPSPDTNAYCCSGSTDGPVLVFVSSSLVRLVAGRELEFVIGHEFGHFLFRHAEYPTDDEAPNDLRLLELRRASEVSADRAGLVACGDVDTALQATLKVASGLDVSLLEVNVGDYISQIRELHESVGDESLLFASHPPFTLRARALLRFDTLVTRMQAGEDIGSARAQIDRDIRRDMDRAATGASGNRFTDAALGAAFWDAALRVCGDGTFSETDQQRLSQKFGQEKVAALKRALGARTRDDARAFLSGKAEEARERLRSAPLFVIRTAEEALRGFR